jgi:flagellar biosynthesis protein FliR
MESILHLDQILAGLVFVGARVGGLMTFAPFFGSGSMPMRIKAGFVVAVTLLLYPAAGLPRIPLELWSHAQLMLSEAVIGILFGLAAQFVFDAAQLAGQILGIQMGFSLVSIIDPQTQADTPVLSIFHQMVVLLIFLQMDVHHWLLRGVAASFVYLPPGSAGATMGATSELLRAAGGIWLAGVQIAAPVLLATMLADIGLGFLGKASPSLPVLFFGLSIKSVLGLVVLVAGMASWPRFFERHFADAIAMGERLLHLARS